MWKQIGVLCGFVLSLALFGCGKRGDAPAQVFRSFAEAVDAGDLAAASSHVSEASLEYFRRLEAWLIKGDEGSMRDLQPFDRYLVIHSRMMLSALSKQDWEVFVGRSRESALPLIDQSFLPILRYHFINLRIGTVEYFGAGAGATLLLNSSVFESRIRFVQEESGWKVDLTGFLGDRFASLMRTYESDKYRNLDRVEEMFRGEFGASFSRELYWPPIKRLEALESERESSITNTAL